MDFPALIARFNVEHSREISGEGVALDIGYFHRLGPTAIPALDAFITDVPASEDARVMRAELVERNTTQAPRDWRSWSFREGRLAAYLEAVPATEVTTR